MSNDRLKFRAWYAGRMYFVCRLWFEWGELSQVFLSEDGDSVADTWAKITDDDLYLMQWTGLYDSEGVEIYEGDVVEYSEGDEWGVAVIEAVLNSCNLFFSWIQQNTKSPSLFDSAHYFGYSKALNIIGNIHESPGLMERPNG